VVVSTVAAKRAVLAAASFVTLLAVSFIGASAAAPPDKDRQAPSAPQNLRVSASTQSTVTLVWDASNDDVGVAGYAILGDRGKATATRPEYIVDGLICGQAVQLSVIAFDDSHNRSERATATVSAAPCSDTQPPASPSGFTQVATSESAVILAWNPSADNVGVVGYGVYRNVEKVASPSDPTVTLSQLSCGTSYGYVVDATDAAGNRSPLATVYVRTSACPPPPPPPSTDTQPPSTPSELSASNVTQTGMTLGWSASTDNIGVAGYDVYRNDVKVASVATTSSGQSGLSCGTSYVYGVAARDGAGNATAQAKLTASTAACSSQPSDTTPPSQPTNLVVASVTRTSVSLSWFSSTDNVGVAGYRTYVNGSAATNPSQNASLVGGLTCGTAYTLEVDAYDAAGNRSSMASIIGSTLPSARWLPQLRQPVGRPPPCMTNSTG
jgi:chitodextrinase